MQAVLAATALFSTQDKSPAPVRCTVNATQQTDDTLNRINSINGPTTPPQRAPVSVRCRIGSPESQEGSQEGSQGPSAGSLEGPTTSGSAAGSQQATTKFLNHNTFSTSHSPKARQCENTPLQQYASTPPNMPPHGTTLASERQPAAASAGQTANMAVKMANAAPAAAAVAAALQNIHKSLRDSMQYPSRGPQGPPQGPPQQDGRQNISNACAAVDGASFTGHASASTAVHLQGPHAVASGSQAGPLAGPKRAASQDVPSFRMACVRVRGQVRRIRVSFHADSPAICLSAVTVPSSLPGAPSIGPSKSSAAGLQAPAGPSSGPSQTAATPLAHVASFATQTAPRGDPAPPPRVPSSGPDTPKSVLGSCSADTSGSKGVAAPSSSGDAGNCRKRRAPVELLNGYECKRKPLGRCSKAEWMADYEKFIEIYNGGAITQELNSKAHLLNRTELDVFALYKEVCKCGGFREGGKHINWSGKIYPALPNYSPLHSCTSVGSQLIQQYRTLLLAYERCHPQDVTQDICSICKGGNDVSEEWVCCEHCETWVHLTCDPREDLGKFSEYVRNRRKYVCTKCLARLIQKTHKRQNVGT